MALKKSSKENRSELSTRNGGEGSNGNGHFKVLAVRNRDADRSAAFKCIIYLLLMLAFFGWFLFDTWIQNHSLASKLGYDLDRMNNNGFRLVAFTIIAGGLGGAVDGIRSVVNHCETFNRKHVWKYISLPWMGCTLALLMYALLRSSIAVLGGNVSSESAGNTQVLANFAIGALAGFGSKDVFIWLDDRVHKIFKVEVPRNVPNVTGKPQDVAASRIEAAKLEVGEVSKVHEKNGNRAGMVIDQSPPPETPIDRGQSVDITVAANGKAN